MHQENEDGSPNEECVHLEDKYYRNGGVGTKTRVDSATAKLMESYEIRGSALHGPVRATIKPNGDVEYSHGYTSRRE